MSPDVQVRRAARVLIVDERERLLLLASTDPESGRRFWFPVGGGLEPGEDARATAAREVAEETGRPDIVVGPEVWTRRHVFSWRGVRYDQRERWFLARVAGFDPDRTRWTDVEKADVTEIRWWTLDALDATGDTLVPRDLAARLRALLADGPPPTPTEVGV